MCVGHVCLYVCVMSVMCLCVQRFGEVVQTSKLPAEESGGGGPAQFLVEFSNMYGAESALRGGMLFNNSALTAEYKAKKARTESMGSNPSTGE